MQCFNHTFWVFYNFDLKNHLRYFLILSIFYWKKLHPKSPQKCTLPLTMNYVKSIYGFSDVAIGNIINCFLAFNGIVLKKIFWIIYFMRFTMIVDIKVYSHRYQIQMHVINLQKMHYIDYKKSAIYLEISQNYCQLRNENIRSRSLITQTNVMECWRDNKCIRQIMWKLCLTMCKLYLPYLHNFSN